MIISAGGKPEETSLKKIFSEPHKAYVKQYERQKNYADERRSALKNLVRKELLDTRGDR